MTNYQGYIEDLTRQDKEYKTTIKEFTQWVTDHNMIDRFREDIRSIGIHNDIYDIALDYSIPVSMIKFFISNSLINILGGG